MNDGMGVGENPFRDGADKERELIVAWLRREADAYGGFDIDGCQTVERTTALGLANAVEQGAHHD